MSTQKATKHSLWIVSNFRNIYREHVADSLDFEDLQIGGPGNEVEIDEPKWGKGNNCGHRVECV